MSLRLIRHVVFFTARRPEDIDAIVDGLALLKGIPHARVLDVVRNRRLDQLGDGPDVVVYGEFDDEAALAAYKADALYARAVAIVRPLRDMRIAADFAG